MFEKLQEKLIELAESAKAKEEMKRNAILEFQNIDEVAAKTEWRPLKGGGSNFKTVFTEKINENFILIKPTLMTKFFAIGFPSIFIIVFSLAFTQGRMLGFIIAGILMIAVAFIAKPFLAPKVFDKNEEVFFQKNNEKYKFKIDFSEIHAVQIIAEYVSGSKNNSSYYSYEINLVLKNGERKNIMDHGNLKSIKEDSQMIADFLNVPLWDISNIKY